MTDDDGTRLARGTASRNDSCLAPKFKKKQKGKKTRETENGICVSLLYRKDGTAFEEFQNFHGQSDELPS